MKSLNRKSQKSQPTPHQQSPKQLLRLTPLGCIKNQIGSRARPTKKEGRLMTRQMRAKMERTSLWRRVRLSSQSLRPRSRNLTRWSPSSVIFHQFWINANSLILLWWWKASPYTAIKWFWPLAVYTLKLNSRMTLPKKTRVWPPTTTCLTNISLCSLSTFTVITWRSNPSIYMNFFR